MYIACLFACACSVIVLHHDVSAIYGYVWDPCGYRMMLDCWLCNFRDDVLCIASGRHMYLSVAVFVNCGKCAGVCVRER